jgi:hypothetical protein
VNKYSSIVSQLQKLKVRIDELETEQKQVQQKLVGCPDRVNRLSDVPADSNPIRQALESMNGAQLLNLITVDLKHIAVFKRQRLKKILPGYPTNLGFGTPDAMTQPAVLAIIQAAIIEDGGRCVFRDEYRQWKAALDAAKTDEMAAIDVARAPFTEDLGHLYTIESELSKLQKAYDEMEFQLPEYEVTVHGIESQTRSRRVSGTITVHAATEEEAEEKVQAIQDDVEFTEDEFWENSESEVEDIEVGDVELISEEEPETAAG